MNLRETLEQHINILIKPLQSEEEIIPVLRRRLTKREYKLLQLLSLGKSSDEICEKMKADSDEMEILTQKLIKKLNQEKLKQELMI